jgi:hypothetical protein
MSLRFKLGELFSAVCATKRRETPKLDLALVTIVNGAWDTSLENTEIDVQRIQAETRPALTAMFENWLAVIELQLCDIETAKHAHTAGDHDLAAGAGFPQYVIEARDALGAGNVVIAVRLCSGVHVHLHRCWKMAARRPVRPWNAAELLNLDFRVWRIAAS